MKHPTKKQFKALKAKGWRRVLDGLAWQSPYDRYYYSPQAAMVREDRIAARQSDSGPGPPESGQDSDNRPPETI